MLLDRLEIFQEAVSVLEHTLLKSWSTSVREETRRTVKTRVKMVRGTAKVNVNDSRSRVNTLGLRDGKAKAAALLKCFPQAKHL
jgi:hypothetical protein